MRNPQTITLNGKQYDALTGKPIVKSLDGLIAEIPVRASQVINKVQSQKPKFIDGFAAVKNSMPNNLLSQNQPKKPTAHTHAPNVKREQSKSKTLMRRPLMKPTLTGRSSIIQPIRKSKYVSRAGEILHQPIDTSKFAATIKSTTDNIQISPLGNTIAELKNKTVTAINRLSNEPPILGLNVHDQNITQIQSIDKDRLAEMIGLDKKTPPKKEPKKPLRKTKRFYIILLTLLILVILGSFGMIFKNNLEIAYISYKTNMSGSLPKYLPLGYKVDNFSYYKIASASSITINYVSGHSITNNFLTINEQDSTLDNPGLISSTINPAVGDNYQTITINGLSVYYYQKTYTWLNKGINYTLTDQTGLTQTIVTKIISSI